MGPGRGLVLRISTEKLAWDVGSLEVHSDFSDGRQKTTVRMGQLEGLGSYLLDRADGCLFGCKRAPHSFRLCLAQC